MSQFNSKPLNGDDGKVLILPKLEEISALGEEWKTAAERANSGETNFPNDSIFTVKGFVPIEGTTPEGKSFRYVALWLEPKDGGKARSYSVKALRKKAFDRRFSPAKLVERPVGHIGLLPNIDEVVGKDVKVIRQDFVSAYSDGRLNDNAVQISFVLVD